MAKKMQNDNLYKTMMNDVISTNQNLQNDLAVFDYAAMTGDWGAFGSYVNAAYDSSADYWRLKMYADGTHELIYDEEKKLSIDYLNENGEVISTSVPEKQDMTGIGMAESLTTVLGSDRALEILSEKGINIQSVKDVPVEIIASVTGYSEESIKQMPDNVKDNIFNDKKDAMIGELLMTQMGASWNVSSWINTEGISLTITDKAYNGNIMAEVQNGKYLYSTVNATLFRDPDSWNSVTSSDGINWEKNTEYWNKDTILYEKTGINYDYYDSLLVDKYQTVVNLSSIASDTAFYMFGNGYISGNTISSDFYMGYYTNWESKSYTQDGKIKYENDVLVLNNTKTISGINIGLHGGENNNWTDRWLAHDTSKLLNNGTYIDTTYGGDIVTGYSAGCFITTRDNQNSLLQYLGNWNFSHGIQISGTIYNDSYTNYLSKYPNTRGLR